jgi:RNA polymerase sigma-70 factor (ECF subfamily)
MSTETELDSRARADRAMDLYADGDSAAFEGLYDALFPALFGFALRLARRRSVAEDVVQQTFLLMHRSRSRWIPGARVFPWAFAIAHHFFLDSVRGRREVQEEEDAPEPSDGPFRAGSAEEELDARRQLAAVMQQVDLLPEKLRLAFQLVVLEGLSVAEAAEVLGITNVNVKVRVHRARMLLKPDPPPGAAPGARVGRGRPSSSAEDVTLSERPRNEGVASAKGAPPLHNESSR